MNVVHRAVQRAPYSDWSESLDKLQNGWLPSCTNNHLIFLISILSIYFANFNFSEHVNNIHVIIALYITYKFRPHILYLCILY